MDTSLFSWQAIPKITTMLCSSLSTGFSSKILFKNVVKQVQTFDKRSSAKKEVLLSLITSLQIVNKLNLFQRNPVKVEQDEKTLKKLETQITEHFGILESDCKNMKKQFGKETFLN